MASHFPLSVKPAIPNQTILFSARAFVVVAVVFKVRKKSFKRKSPDTFQYITFQYWTFKFFLVFR
jgi:hypothetical protein